MLLTPNAVTALLQALGLGQSLTKPIGGIVGVLDGVLNTTGQTVEGVLDGLGLSAADGLLNDILISGGNAKSTKSSKSPPLLISQDSNATNATCYVEPYNPGPLPIQGFPPFDQAKANVFRYRSQQSVNMGSWFVHEQWMTPSVFSCASGPQQAEIDIATGWGSPENAQTVLERHWDSFINQSDFEYLASVGINTVRLPIGYWSLGPAYCQGTPFEAAAGVYNNSWSRVVRAINWADEAGIGIIVDLHGAPGSQNGQPHSGISDGQANFFNNATNMELTMNVLTFLVQQLASVSNVIGVELLNEPNDDPTLSDFYTEAIGTLRQISPVAASFPIYIQDAFDLQRFSEFVGERTDFVVNDHHSYFVFTSADNIEPAADHTADVKGYIAGELAKATSNARGNLIIGEWSCALTPDSLANVTDVLLVRQAFCQGQEQTYGNTTAGWSFWSYMKDDCSTDLDWCFKNAVNNTLPATFYSYGQAAAMNSSEQMEALTLALDNMQLPSFSEVLNNASMANKPEPKADSESSNSTFPLSSMTITTAETSTTSSTISGAPTAFPDDRLAPVESSFSGTVHRDLSSQRRFRAIHNRRSSFLSKRDNLINASTTSPTSAAGLGFNVTETAITKGYSDGFLTAKIFAQYDLSKLGFVDQYISDSIAALGSQVVAPGSEEYYAQWFARGLADGETLISEALSM